MATDPFGLMEFATCEHKRLKCEKCGAVSDIRGWMTFTGHDQLIRTQAEEIEQLRADLRSEIQSELALANAYCAYATIRHCEKRLKELADA